MAMEELDRQAVHETLSSSVNVVNVVNIVNAVNIVNIVNIVNVVNVASNFFYSVLSPQS